MMTNSHFDVKRPDEAGSSSHWGAGRTNRQVQETKRWTRNSRELVWLPVVDAFLTLVACPPPGIRPLFAQIQEFAVC